MKKSPLSALCRATYELVGIEQQCDQPAVVRDEELGQFAPHTVSHGRSAPAVGPYESLVAEVYGAGSVAVVPVLEALCVRPHSGSNRATRVRASGTLQAPLALYVVSSITERLCRQLRLTGNTLQASICPVHTRP